METEQSAELSSAIPTAADPESPRLMISKIVCTNFKSYAGVKELGPFHKVWYSRANGAHVVQL